MATKTVKEITTDVGGNVSVEYSDDSTSSFNLANTVTAVSNPLTGGIELIGPGGEVIEVGGASLRELLSRGTVMKACWLGNSLIASGYRMMDRLTVLSSGRILTIKNAGVSGRSLQGVIDAMVADIDPAADIVFVSEGSNSSTQNVVPGAYYPLMKQVVDYVVSLGKICIVCASPPRNSNPVYLTRTVRYPWSEYLAATDGKALFIDPYYKWRASDGGYIQGYSTDKTHPAVERQDLYDFAAESIWDALNPYTSGRRKPYMEVLSNDDNAGYTGLDNTAAGVVKGNALLQTTAGWTNTDATNITFSLESASPFRGNKLVMTVSGIGSLQTVERIYNVNNATVEPSLGDVLHGRAVFECTESSNLTAYAYLTAGSAYAQVDMLMYRSSPFQAEMFDGTTPPLGTTNQTKHSLQIKLQPTHAISFVASGSGTTLTAASVTSGTGGVLLPGHVISGVGIPTGTKIVSQTSGTEGGAGVYVTSVATTASSATCTVLAAGKVSVSNADIYNLTKLRSGTGYV